MSVFWLDKDKLFAAAVPKFQKTDTLLDIGCGIMPQRFVRPLVHICCEPFDQYISHLQEKVKNEYDRSYVVIKATWAEAVEIFPPKSVDSVFLVDVIEHLEKGAALDLLKATELIAKKQIAVFTPLGFMPQHHEDGKDAWGLDGAAWQEHKSGWQPEDFDESWDVYVTDEFHSVDNLGRKLEAPYGALWAIRAIPQQMEGVNSEIERKKAKLRALVDAGVESKMSPVLYPFIILMNGVRMALNTWRYIKRELSK